MSVYYEPERYGLTVLHEHDPPLSYEFHMLVLWVHKSGKLLMASDSGCSCPSPFEDYTSLRDLTPVGSIEDIQSVVAEYNSVAYGGHLADTHDFVMAARGYL